MRFLRLATLPFFFFAFITPCFAHHMAVVVNKENSAGNVTAMQLSRMFHFEVKKWPDGKAITIVLHKDSAGEIETLEHLVKINAAELKSLEASHKDSIVLVDSDADVTKVVQSMPGAVGLIELHSVDNTINVMRVDGKLPMESGYLPH
jgi:ABC-type phosphate transport system substrate-binding protein